MWPFKKRSALLTSSVPSLEHRFNDDLLIGVHDQALAKSEYAEIYHVLDHPELRKEFLCYDGVAITARLKVHRFGLLAVSLTVFALLGSATTPLLRQVPGVPEWAFAALFYAEVGGLVGVIISAGGMWIAGNKKKWLEARMMAEVLRIWHFQSLICRGEQIESACDPGTAGGLDAYRKTRDVQFKKFLHEWAGSPDSHLMELIESPEAGYQMLHDEPTMYAPKSAVVEKIFSAYKSMRFRHQANYAAHKLQRQTNKPFSPLKWPSAVLQARMQSFTSFCLLGSLICSCLIVLGHVLHLGWSNSAALPVVVVVFLILTVAGRTIQDGLASPEELQRYNDYAGKIRYLMEKFDTPSQEPSAKLNLMVEMERAALEELKGFLRAHFEARFVI